MSHFFVFGSFPEISLAELYQTLVFIDGAGMKVVTPFGATVDGLDDNHAVALFHRLGGTTRVGRVVAQSVVRHALEHTLTTLVTELVSDRVHFGISVLGGGLPTNQVQGMGITIKHALKDHGRSSRFVVSRDPMLSSVVVEKNHLLTKGAEFILKSAGSQSFDIIQTLAVQEFEQWGNRDFGRPARDARRGMLPPKLARMMIHLARINNQESIIKLLDPFCGSGTVLMEALELGCNVIGSDISAQAVEDTKKNLEWVATMRRHSEQREESRDPSAKPQDDNRYKLFSSDVRSLSQKIQPHSIDAIVTEPDLGLPQSKMISSPEDIRLERQRLNPLYLQAIEVFSTVLKKGGRAIVSWPCWPMANKKGIVYAISDLDRIRAQGFEIIPPIPSALSKAIAPKQFHYRHSLLYGRPDQFVWREIMILEKR